MLLNFCVNDTAITESYTYCHSLALHYALPISFQATDKLSVKDRLERIIVGGNKRALFRIASQVMKIFRKVGHRRQQPWFGAVAANHRYCDIDQRRPWLDNDIMALSVQNGDMLARIVPAVEDADPP